MAKVVQDKWMQVSPDKLYAAIADVTKYPDFLSEVVSSTVLPGATENGFRVKFEIEVVKRFSYTLEFMLEPRNRVHWKLIESDFFKKNDGKWELSPKNDGTQVHYELDVEFGFLVPGWISRKLTEVNLPKMFESFEGAAGRIGGKLNG